MPLLGVLRFSARPDGPSVTRLLLSIPPGSPAYNLTNDSENDGAETRVRAHGVSHAFDRSVCERSLPADKPHADGSDAISHLHLCLAKKCAGLTDGRIGKA